MVPQDTYSSLLSQQKQTYSPVVEQMSNLDQDLQMVLSNSNLLPEQKYHQYQQIFGRYQQLRNEYFQPAKTYLPTMETDMQTGPDLPTEKFPVDERRLLESLPKTVRRKGKILMDHMKDHSQSFNWLDSGEMVVDGKPIPGSNITDLVHHVTRNRPTAQPPAGMEEFHSLLERTNAPKEAISEGPSFMTTPIELGTSFKPQKTSTPARRKAIKASPRPNRKKNPIDRLGQWKQY